MAAARPPPQSGARAMRAMGPTPRAASTAPRPSAAAAAAAARAALSAPARWIDEHLGGGPVTAERALGGSAWASFGSVETASGARFFVKTAAGGGGGADAAAAMFRGEMLGLNALRDASDASGAGLAVPRVFYGGAAPPATMTSSGGSSSGSGSSPSAFIVMEWLDLGGGASSSSPSSPSSSPGDGRSLQARLGEALARVHSAPVPAPPGRDAPQFGFPVDNTIGGTPQPNAMGGDWVAFFRERRLRHMLRLARDASLAAAAAPVLDGLELLFRDYAPGGACAGGLVPSVLHGDLWSGNYGAAALGGDAVARPAVFDPAVYYGHSEAEFGMSWCAGFTDDFWRSYHAERAARGGRPSPAPGFEARRDLYKLYHYLNHLVLFGGGYRGECARCIDRLAAVVRAGGVPAR